MKTTSTFARRSVSFLLAGVAAAALAGCLQAGDSDTESDDMLTDAVTSPVSVGLHAVNNSVATVKDRQKKLGGVSFDHVLLFRKIQSPSGVVDQVQPFLDAGKDVVINIEFDGKTDDTKANGVLKAIIDGDYNDDIHEYVKQLNQLDRKGHSVSVRILHEMNGNWYPWCVNGFQNNTVAGYVAAYRLVSGKMPDWVKMQLNFTAHDQGGDVDWSKIYPGKDYVDMVLFTVYNLYGLNGHKVWKGFGELVNDPYQRAKNAPFADKPFGISEISSMPDPANAGHKGEWFKGMANDIVNNHPKIKEVSFFLEDKQFGGDLRCWDWAYATADGDPSNKSCPYGSTRSTADKNGMGRAVQILHGN